MNKFEDMIAWQKASSFMLEKDMEHGTWSIEHITLNIKHVAWNM
ncbi:MAG: hypothetical protein RBT35_08850 [Bacteroidales bacterium]|jgi:hypothetical protein|nr:hypothetical protein [Bacteroidales bacterium]